MERPYALDATVYSLRRTEIFSFEMMVEVVILDVQPVCFRDFRYISDTPGGSRL